jgi:hypothetical protein
MTAARKPSAAEMRAVTMYARSVADIPNVHALGWSELPEATRRHWIRKAAEAMADEPATPEFIERMRRGHKPRLAGRRGKKP